MFLVMAVYYGWRMFALTPWYDELYTYYYFISRGPVYAAIHWPLPNNHVGYSVLSAFLNYLGNPYIGLRGVSYLCALANLWLVYRLADKYMAGWTPLGCVVLFASANLVNQQAVQGRGYTLGVTCFLTAWLCMQSICGQEQVKRRIYVIYVSALTLGLYTVTSNVYWVIPLCLAGGIYLLLAGIYEKSAIKKLIRLIAASLTAAVFTVILYTIIWLAIGSNLLVSDGESIYMGMGHVQMILKNPFAAILRGMQYMLDTPYIQSEERAGFLGRFGEWLVNLAGYYFSFLPWLVLMILLLGAFIFLYIVIKKKEQLQGRLLYLVLSAEILFVPICLLIQCKRPYYRVFTYGGVVLAFSIAALAELFLRKLDQRRRDAVMLLTAGTIGLICFCFSGYNGQYGMQEYYVQDALSHGNVEESSQLCVTDCNQEYLLLFQYGIRCENREIEGTDLVLLDKRMTDPDFEEMVWEFYHYYDTIPWEYINENMTLTYENEGYVLYSLQ